MPQIIAGQVNTWDGTFRSFVDEGTPLVFSIQTDPDASVTVTLDDGSTGYWVRTRHWTDKPDSINYISDASCLSMLLDAIHRGLKVTTSNPWSKDAPG